MQNTISRRARKQNFADALNIDRNTMLLKSPKSPNGIIKTTDV